MYCTGPTWWGHGINLFFEMVIFISAMTCYKEYGTLNYFGPGTCINADLTYITYVISIIKLVVYILEIIIQAYFKFTDETGPNQCDTRSFGAGIIGTIAHLIILVVYCAVAIPNIHKKLLQLTLEPLIRDNCNGGPVILLGLFIAWNVMHVIGRSILHYRHRTLTDFTIFSWHLPNQVAVRRMFIAYDESIDVMNKIECYNIFNGYDCILIYFFHVCRRMMQILLDEPFCDDMDILLDMVSDDDKDIKNCRKLSFLQLANKKI